MANDTSSRKALYAGGLVVIVIVVGCVLALWSSAPNLVTAKLATLPDSYYQAMVVSGGVAKNLEGIAFSPNGQHVAYVVKQNGKSAVYYDGIASPWHDSVSLSPFAFSSDSKHYLYAASDGSDSFVVVDGKEQQHYQDGYIDSSSLLTGATGVPAYTMVKSGINLSEYVVFNGHAGKTYRIVEYLKVSPDGQSAIYYGCKNDYTNPNGYDNALSHGTGFCSFVVQDLDGTVHESDGIFYSQGINEATYHGNSTYSPDGKLLAYVSRLGDEDSFTINGVKTFAPPGDYPEKNISGVVFSRDSKHTAYLVQGCDANNPCPLTSFGQPTGGIWYTVLDNTTVGQKYNEIENLTFDSQGQLAYFARSGNQWALVDGANTYAVPADFSKFPSLIQFSPDNSYLYSYTNSSGKTVLISDGKEVVGTDDIEFPSFTPDGKIIYTTASSDASSMSLVIDGVAHKHDFVEPFLTLPASVYGPYYHFTQDGSVIYGAIDGQDISRIVRKI